MGYFPVRYDSRVIIYERKIFIRFPQVFRPPDDRGADAYSVIPTQCSSFWATT